MAKDWNSKCQLLNCRFAINFPLLVFTAVQTKARLRPGTRLETRSRVGPDIYAIGGALAEDSGDAFSAEGSALLLVQGAVAESGYAANG